MSDIIHFNSSGLEQALSADGVLLVDFWATWCGPCRIVAPTIAALAGEYDGKITVGKVDIDQNPELALKYEVMSIPNVIVFKDGEEFDRLVGAMPPDSYRETLDRALQA